MYILSISPSPSFNAQFARFHSCSTASSLLSLSHAPLLLPLPLAPLPPHPPTVCTATHPPALHKSIRPPPPPQSHRKYVPPPAVLPAPKRLCSYTTIAAKLSSSPSQADISTPPPSHDLTILLPRQSNRPSLAISASPRAAAPFPSRNPFPRPLQSGQVFDFLISLFFFFF
ncbi:hypothetical protein IWX90DRAFT_425409, partial [Phyllosticta citrichinensis]